MNRKILQENLAHNLEKQAEKANESREKLHAMIQSKLSHLQHSPHRASIEYFLETGTVNGAFLMAIMDIIGEYRFQK